MKKRVRFQGKWYHWYPEEGVLKLLDGDYKEVEGAEPVTEFKEEDLEQIFKASDIQSIREEARAYREQLDALKQQLGGIKPEEIQKLTTELANRKKTEEEERRKRAEEEGKWPQLLEEQRNEYEAKLAAITQERDGWQGRYRRTVIDNAILGAASDAKIVDRGATQVVNLLRDMVDLDENDQLYVYEGTDKKTRRYSAKDGKPMSVRERVDLFLEENPHFRKGHAGGAGSGGGSPTDLAGKIDQNLPPTERLKIARRAQASAA